MGIFDKVKDVASAAVGATIHSSKENAKLIGVRAELTTLNEDLKSSYEMVGRRFVDFLVEAPADVVGGMPDIGVSDLLRHMEPKLEKKKVLEAELARIEKELGDSAVLQDKQAIEKEFLKEREKLEKAKKMGVLSDAEYASMLAVARRKLDCFEEIRRLEKQKELGILSAEAFAAKMQELGLT
jgi:hypothetical protein